MIKLLLKFALRNLKTQGLYTLINVGGLTLGLLAFFVVILHVTQEKSYDRFNKKIDRIYRLTSATNERVGAIVPYVWGHQMKDEISEIENVVSFQNITIALTVKKGSDVYAQHGFLGVDSTFLAIFDYPVLKGNRKEFLKKPDKMIITPEMATKYFSGEDPIGKTLQVNLWGTYVTFEVEGIVYCPKNAHLRFNFLIPIELVKRNFFNPKAFDSWTTHFAYTYFLMNAGFDRQKVEKDMKSFLMRHGGNELADKFTPALQPLKDIYLKSNVQFDFQPRGDFQQILILLVVAFGILIMAVINFTNISSAQSLSRLKEISLRKILGSGKAALFLQFIIESAIVAISATVLAILIILLFNSFFNGFTGITLLLPELLTLTNVILALMLGFLVGGLSGVYPALLLSSFKPISILRSRSGAKIKKGLARRILVIVQFSLAIILLSATGVVYNQVQYMIKKDLGFNKEQVIILESAREVASNPSKMELFRNTILNYGVIQAITSSSSFPGDHEGQSSARYIPEGISEDESVALWTIYADHDFVRTYDLKLVQGRDFDRSVQSDSTAILINEAAVRQFSNSNPAWMISPLNKYLEYGEGKKGKVIGILKDFHFESLKQELNPLVIQINPQNAFSIQARLKRNSIAEGVRIIESTWKELFPGIPFGYSFLDQRFAVHFESDQRLGRVLQIFTVLSIVIAALGLFGLATFQGHQKSREMSIRKLMGASVRQLTFMLSWDFLRLIIIANIIAIPLSYILMHNWLQGFSFREDPSIYVFLMATGFSLFIASITIGKQAYRTATVDPVDMLNKD